MPGHFGELSLPIDLPAYESVINYWGGGKRLENVD